jgi:hypothetical protein
MAAALVNLPEAGIKAPPGAIPPRIQQPARLRNWPWALVGFGTMCAPILYWFDPAHFGFYPTCGLYRTTGLFCPGCGSLRAMHHLLHGHLLEALRFNALLVCSLPFVSAAAGLWLLRKWHDQPFSLPLKPAWVWFGTIIVVVFTIARNLPFVRALGLTP